MRSGFGAFWGRYTGEEMKLNPDFVKRLACPLCKKLLQQQEDRLVCPQCGRRYPIREGIPILLPDEAEQ